MRWGVLSVVVMSFVSSRLEAACLDPATLASSIVNITREFGEAERKAEVGVLGIGGTGWFLAPHLIVTAAHVVEAMHLSAGTWTEIEVRERDRKALVAVQILDTVGANAEKLAVLELKNPFPGAIALPMRTEPLVRGEPLASLAYPDRQLRTASGRFMQLGSDDRTAGAALLEMYDGNDRLVLDHGASGAPVIDCSGRVVAVVVNLMTRNINFFSKVMRVSTPWDSPNVASVPVQSLKNYAPR